MSEKQKANRTYAALALASAAVLLSLVVAGVSLISRFSTTNAARSNNAHVWHEVICSIERFSIQRPDSTIAEKRAAVKFYDSLLTENVKTEPCGFAAKLNRR